MKPYQQRVHAEQEYLDERLVKLRAFLEEHKPDTEVKIEGTEETKYLDRAEHERLTRQVAAMQAYLDILNERIAAFVE